ncbi:hypothetical protein LMG9673_04760 [Ralstonia pseudosolanacearum]|nr:hypothetical protein LMG9673_04760 [Ralstonia pseudosolanacearum]
MLPSASAVPALRTLPASARLPSAWIVPVFVSVPADSATFAPPTIWPLLASVPPVDSDRLPAFWIVPLLKMPWAALIATLLPCTFHVPVLWIDWIDSVSVLLAFSVPSAAADGSKAWFGVFSVRLLPASSCPPALLKLPAPPLTVKVKLPVVGDLPVRSPPKNVPPRLLVSAPAVTSSVCEPTTRPPALSRLPVVCRLTA